MRGVVTVAQMVGVIDAVIFKKPLRVVHGPIKSKFGESGDSVAGGVDSSVNGRLRRIAGKPGSHS